MSKPAHIDALTGLRFFAAAAIFVWHLRGSFVGTGAFSPLYLAGAVPLFFVLSGFVLAVGGHRSGGWSDFMVSRVARIWPAHVAALTLLILAFWPWSKVHFETAESLTTFGLNLFLLQDWFPVNGVYVSHNGVAWSISAELAFYAAFPLIYRCVRKAPAVTLAVITGMVIAWILGIGFFFPAVDKSWLGSMNPVSGVWAFAIGVLAGCWYADRGRRERALSPAAWTGIEIAALAAALAANVFLYRADLTALPQALRIFVAQLGAAPFYALLIAVLALSKGHTSRLLSGRAITYLGEISFSFYLVHQIVIRRYLDVPGALEGQSKAMGIVTVLAISLALSALIYHAIEMQMRRLIVTRWRERRAASRYATAPAAE